MLKAMVRAGCRPRTSTPTGLRERLDAARASLQRAFGLPMVRRSGARAKPVKRLQDWGIAGDARNARRSIEVGITDNMRFTPERIEARQGETLKFVVRNAERRCTSSSSAPGPRTHSTPSGW
jgi:hypothetical protein